ncbi:MAG: DEAD/DEAH box helicase [Armatimonadota bacterium]|nr:DEAD/DEAH box helicase [Armatimonadota bacterium]MDR5696504.1 DEAD/DEAH box helicase [Armatimonadota bacterium]
MAFEPSLFQREALSRLREGDVLVEAPTGSGKTWIAEEAIREGLRAGRSAWYTTPLKALSNQKFRRFQNLYGADRVGLLTGERKINAQAPVIVATTEILRNALYDRGSRTEESQTAQEMDLVVLDEAHYLSDPERGTAWEEILMYAPRRTRLLLLSATLPNAGELSDWLAEARGRRPAVVEETVRPVPLCFVAVDARGRLLPVELAEQASAGCKRPDWIASLLGALRAADLLPAILFFPARRDCDEAAAVLARSWAGPRGSPPDSVAGAKRLEERQAAWAAWTAELPHLASHAFRAGLLAAGVAPHHAGHTTSWRLVVEDFLERGLLTAVCATTTLAAGLDVPARTVVLTTLVRNSPTGPVSLSATEFHQMAGRAGRRGRDKIGVVALPATRYGEVAEAESLAGAAPEPIRSAFTPSYSQVLNWLAARPLDAALAELDRSLAAFQRRGQIASLRAQLDAIPPDPLVDRPCDDRLHTRARYERMAARRDRLRRLRDPDAAEEVRVLTHEMSVWPCACCAVAAECLSTIDRLRAREQRRLRLRRELRELHGGLREEFAARARVLRGLGYLDAEFRPTAYGRWAALVRHPRCIVIVELVRRRLLPAEPERLAAYAAALSSERAPRAGDDADLAALARLVEGLAEIEAHEGVRPDPLVSEFKAEWDRIRRRRVPSPADRRGWAAIQWMREAEFGTLCEACEVAEGDLQRILLQAAEVCNQLADLPQPGVGEVARATRDRILRDPLL